jgi:hypothetical protein
MEDDVTRFFIILPWVFRPIRRGLNRLLKQAEDKHDPPTNNNPVDRRAGHSLLFREFI